MNNVAARAGLTALGVGALALLMGVGYLAEKGFGQLYAPMPSGNDPQPSNRPRWDNSPRPRDPIPEGESIWEDYTEDELDYKQRMPERPGNFDVIKKIGEFFEDNYQVEPKVRNVAYPFQVDSKTIASQEASVEASKSDEQKRRDSGEKRKNKLRQYNFIIHKITLLRFAPGEAALTNPKEMGINEKQVERFAAVRKAHPERCYLALIRVGWESLQSAKIEGDNDDSDMILAWVQKSDGWRLVWFEK